MQLEDNTQLSGYIFADNLFSIPAILDNYSRYANNLAVAFIKTDFVYSFVHFGDNLFNDNVINGIQTYLNENVNGIYTNYVIFYSPLLPNKTFLELEKQYNNFIYVHLPLIAFGQIPYHINIEHLPEINYKYKKNFCCLTNRSTDLRYSIFNFLQEKNLLDLGFVSYRNVKRYSGSNGEYLLSEPFKNFKETHYADVDDLDSQQQMHYVWSYPLEDFLFDFSSETWFEDTPFLTEKSTKAFFWGKIPVSISSRNLMHYIEQFGFDIFRDVIDYKYDIQRDKDLRMELYLQEIHKLATMDINTIPDLKIRLENNRRLMCTLVKRSQTTLESINLNTRYIAENRDKFLGY